MTLRPAVFLDRDGVVNHAPVRDGRPFAPMSVAEVEVLPDAAAACRELRDHGFVLVVVTNQPEVARGRVTAEVLDAMHAHIAATVPIDAFVVCPHDDADGCSCRKPAPGMVLTAASERGLDLARSYLVGDRWRDVAAGHAAGVSTVFVDRGYAERAPDAPDRVVASLREAAAWILEDSARRRPSPADVEGAR